mmetsp:Transcript_9369/g.23289  ORF Transcript_9369/g.23289 Transcript_9369/m.23289 type:complete len:93 (+) Transcript_9369:708-986(+)
MSAFGMGGWWLGNKHMRLNTRFMGSVRRGIPTDANVIVACQKGLRSLSACEQLAKNGYAPPLTPLTSSMKDNCLANQVVAKCCWKSLLDTDD